MISERANHMAAEHAKQKEEIIIAHIPPDVIISDMLTNGGCNILPNGVEQWHYRGVPFLEVHPPEFKTVHEGYTTKIIATQKYRSLK